MDEQKEIKMEFAPIDARDCALIGVYAFSFYGIPKTPHNYKIIKEAELAYLNELAKLQLKIRKMYEPLLKPESNDEEKMHWTVKDSLEREVEEKFYKNRKSTFRSSIDYLYYT